MRTELQIPSDLQFLAVVENWLLGALGVEFGDMEDWQQQSGRLRLALVEAYSNVVRHAHRDQPQVPVIMRLEWSDRTIRLEVWDRGDGYDLNTYTAPSPEDFQDGGYGWLILNRLMDKVEYRLRIGGQNCLILETTLPASDVNGASTVPPPASPSIETSGSSTEPSTQPL
jgi:serine/threonine-protein kinase RsbW